LGEAFKYWLKLGFISFGGPAGQIAMMHQELVERRRWISEHRYLHALNYCMLLPGPEAIQLAIYISWLMHGIRGAMMAGVSFFLPAFLLLSVLAGVYLHFGDVPAVQGIFYLIKPAVVAVVLFAAWRIGARTIKNEACSGASPRWPLSASSFSTSAFPGSCWPRHPRGHRRQAAAGQVQERRWPWRLEQAVWPGADRRRYPAPGACPLHLAKAAGDQPGLFPDLGAVALLALSGSDRSVQHG
jgi:chromate transport protein ChrA